MMKTSTGFEFEVTKDALNNMELLDALAELQETNGEDITLMGRLITMLLGREGKKALYDHVREEDGRVPVDKTTAEMTEIFNLMSEDLKKSSSSQE